MDSDYYTRPPFRHCRMSTAQRAKQFAPFAALVNFDSAIEKEETRHKEITKKILSEDAIKEINSVLCSVVSGTKIELSFFIEGRYRKAFACVVENNFISKFLRITGLSDNDVDFALKVPYSDIYKLKKL